MDNLTRQQRFAKNVKKDMSGGMQGKAFRTKGFTFPTHEQMDAFDKYHIPHNVDPALRDAVIDLNKRGYCTSGSCQGGHLHNKRTNERNTGFIAITPHKSEYPQQYQQMRLHHSKKVVNPNEVKQVLKSHNIKVKKHDPPYFRKGEIKDFHAFEFDTLPSNYEYDAS
jgi:hypothetical protein